ncbi:Fur-regulated basic protein FbpA [Niallia sp. XMNu-256]|uniref:Fur-regulated basic protein FbpA n=1 Tax=Niallia sp. XMNu-256 TaxID=3082444 RepID=UPI0030D1BAC5
METLFQDDLEKEKSLLIDKLIRRGIYKKDNTHLFELSLSDLEKEYNKIQIS